MDEEQDKGVKSTIFKSQSEQELLKKIAYHEAYSTAYKLKLAQKVVIKVGKAAGKAAIKGAAKGSEVLKYKLNDLNEKRKDKKGNEKDIK
ncbi:hypothetical protein QE109_06820 [Fusibacter bizertensis]|uniref:Uncharacterized protein n=1 Tax=Fusibacter bizertensis TaxID=1488331 RepID=A0ABT6NBQ6_9FIRM|nr:hypothetical protein [Fusibacter bizertensis]MDH8677852.1 hypothetical protein [Fusibacter bizertensis]